MRNTIFAGLALTVLAAVPAAAAPASPLPAEAPAAPALLLESSNAALAGLARRTIVFHLAQQPLPEAIGPDTYAFPHLVTRAMAERVSAGHEVCSVGSTSGVPSALRDRRTGAPVPLMTGWPDPTVNPYYPSPQMHQEAAEALATLF